MRRMDEPEFLKLAQMEFDHIRKRLRGMAMISRGIVPNVVLSRRAVDKMLSAADQFLADETGEAMVGFVVEDDTPEGLPTIYVLDTISPDETAVRRSHTFSKAMPSKMRSFGGCKRTGTFIENGIAVATPCPIALMCRFDIWAIGTSSPAP